jgi:hypothetical protein
MVGDRGKNSDVGLNFVLPSELWETIGDEHFFFAITVEELPKSKICQTNYSKLLELL